MSKNFPEKNFLSFLVHGWGTKKLKSHRCEEGGACPRIYFWYLLMKSKSNYLLKKAVEVGQ